MLWGCCVLPSCAAPWTSPAYRIRHIGWKCIAPIVRETIKDLVVSFQTAGGSYVHAQSKDEQAL
jgi:hypothetical protein